MQTLLESGKMYTIVHPKFRSVIVSTVCVISADKPCLRGDSELCQIVYFISTTVGICLDQAGFCRAIYTSVQVIHCTKTLQLIAQRAEKQCRDSSLVLLQSALKSMKFEACKLWRKQF